MNDDFVSEISSNDESYNQIGFVYLLIRQEKNIDLIKIGFTSRLAQDRAKNYTDGKWKVAHEFSMPLWLARRVEKRSHEILKKEEYWLNPEIVGGMDGAATEIFTCSKDIAEVAVLSAIDSEVEAILRSLKLPISIIKCVTKSLEGCFHLSETEELSVSKFYPPEIIEIEKEYSSLKTQLEELLCGMDFEIQNRLSEEERKYVAGLETLLEKRNEELQELNQLRIKVIDLEKELEKRNKVLLFESNKEVYFETKKLLEKKDEALEMSNAYIQKLELELKRQKKK